MKYYLKQLIPLTYTSEYTDDEGDKVCIWKMWLGRSYNIKHYKICSKGCSN